MMNLLNKDLVGTEEEYHKAITNDFIGTDFEEQLEWAMLMIGGNFKQIRLADYLPPVSKNHFDKAYLMSATLNEGQKFFEPFTDCQATPEMFPLLNIKWLNISDNIVLSKYKEMSPIDKRNLRLTRRYAYEQSVALYNKETECFYGRKYGYEVNPAFFRHDWIRDWDKTKVKLEEVKHILPKQFCLHPNYKYPDIITPDDVDPIVTLMKHLAMAYQVAFSMYYEWSIYIKEKDNIGLVIPIEAAMLSEIYKTSMLRFDTKKAMLHFVRDHYRRKAKVPNEDYSVFVKRYLRGECKFDYRGFYAEIIPPKYDLLRVKTRKKFIDTFS